MMKSRSFSALGQPQPAVSHRNDFDSDEPSLQPAPADSESHMHLQMVIDPAVRQRIDLAWLEHHLRAALVAIANERRIGELQVEAVIVDDTRMIRLHRQHKGIESTTDVLTFDLSEDKTSVEAQIVVCADEAARRASDFNHKLERELLLYCVHGVLHCLGFDDHDEAGYQTMHETEDRILNQIGVGTTFHMQPRSRQDLKGESE